MKWIILALLAAAVTAFLVQEIIYYIFFQDKERNDNEH